MATYLLDTVLTCLGLPTKTGHDEGVRKRDRHVNETLNSMQVSTEELSKFVSSGSGWKRCVAQNFDVRNGVGGILNCIVARPEPDGN